MIIIYESLILIEIIFNTKIYKIMKIEISKKDYEILLKHSAIWNWVYWIMSDMVSSKYKKEVSEWDELIHKILKNCDNGKITTVYDWKNIFTDIFTDTISEVMSNYENYVVEDLTWIDIEKINNEIDNDLESNPLFKK